MERVTPAFMAAQLRQVLPRGDAWPREADTNLMRFIDAVAIEMAALRNAAADLRDEADPRTALKLLADYERIAGLPDPCAGEEQTLVGRRRRLVATLTARGGASGPYFVNLAASLGYEIQIVESRPLAAGFAAGAPCWNESAAYHWRVRAPLNSITYLAAGFGAGDALSSWGNEPLECFIRVRAPGHSIVDFTYVPSFGGPISLPAEAILGGGPIIDEPEFVVSPGSLA